MGRPEYVEPVLDVEELKRSVDTSTQTIEQAFRQMHTEIARLRGAQAQYQVIVKLIRQAQENGAEIPPEILNAITR